MQLPIDGVFGATIAGIIGSIGIAILGIYQRFVAVNIQMQADRVNAAVKTCEERSSRQEARIIALCDRIVDVEKESATWKAMYELAAGVKPSPPPENSKS